MLNFKLSPEYTEDNTDPETHIFAKDFLPDKWDKHVDKDWTERLLNNEGIKDIILRDPLHENVFAQPWWHNGWDKSINKPTLEVPIHKLLNLDRDDFERNAAHISNLLRLRALHGFNWKTGALHQLDHLMHNVVPGTLYTPPQNFIERAVHNSLDIPRISNQSLPDIIRNYGKHWLNSNKLPSEQQRKALENLYSKHVPEFLEKLIHGGLNVRL